ncbi:hypothetical protein GW932_04400 [archaeon]|nr:hypothetical protein [archaeon]
MRRASLVETLKKKHNHSKQNRKHIEKYIEELENKFKKGEITYKEFISYYYKKTEGKTPHEWRETYQKLEREYLKKLALSKITLWGGVIVFLLLITFFFVRPLLTGFVVGEQQSNYFEIIKLNFNQSGVYNLTPEELGKLTSISISGKISNYGKIKITIENLTIFDTEQIKEKNLSTSNKIIRSITGQVIEDQNITQPKETSFDNLPIEKENQTQIPTQPKEEILNETSPSEISPPLENITNETNTNLNITENITEKQTQIPTQPKEEILNETSPSEISPPLENITNETRKETNIENYCFETCSISLPKKEFYEIKIEIENSTLSLEKINYKIKNPEIANITENKTQIISENITLKNEPIKLGEPVKWKKTITLDEKGSTIVEIPIESKNIEVNKITENVTENLSSSEKAKYSIKGKPSSEIKKSFSLTGKVVQVQETNETIQITIEDNATIYEVEYETSPPQKEENIISPSEKQIKIYSENELNYTEILAYTNLEVETDKKGIEMYHLVDNEKIKINLTKRDTNNNGKIDYLEWIVPHLSNQTYLLELTIINTQSYPMVEDNWTVEFTTTGIANLTIKGINETTFGENFPDDLKFLELLCDTKLQTASLFNNSIFIENYECKKTSFETSKVLTSGVHALEFDFGGVKDYANNFATYSPITCSELWGFDCGTGPPETGGDNTFDTCENGLGADESVEQIYLSSKTVYLDEELEVTCEFDPYTSNDDLFIWYYNGTGWNKIFQELNVGSTGNINRTVVFTPNQTIGTHWIRCGIIYGTGTDSDNCMNTGSWYDNDDMNFTLISSNFPPTTPTNISCNNGGCNITINSGVELNSSGSIDSENNTINYFIEALLENVTTYLNTSTNSIKTTLTPRNTSTKTCFQEWGFDCGTGPPETGGDNTFDSCNYGSGADESVEKIYINSTKVYPGDRLSVTCEFDPYRRDDDTYIWYYNGTGWRKLFEHIGWGSNKLVNETTTFTVDNVTGTHWVRCGIGYYTDTDTCQDTTNYFDNDDVSFNVINPYGEQEKNSTIKTFNDLAIDNTELTKIEIKIEIDSYNPTYSSQNGNLKPDLFLQAYNGTTWIDLGVLGLPTKYTSQTLDTTNQNFTISITDQNILNSWQSKVNQDITIKGIYLDSGDEINFTNIWINLIHKNWIFIGNHTEQSSFYWNTTNIPEQTCIDFRARSIDLLGSNSFSDYFIKNSCLNISHELNEPPIIEKIFTETMTDVSGGLNEGPLPTNITIKYSVFDNNGFQDLIDSSAKINFIKAGEVTRNTTCERIVSESNGNYANFTCEVKMWWFDGPGTWNIEAEIKDSENNIAQNNSNTFYVGATSGFFLRQANIFWNELTPSAQNNLATDGIILNNIGNTEKNIEINSTNLKGEIDNTKIIYANNFSVGPQNDCLETTMNHFNFITIENSLLTKGNYTLNNGTGQEELFFCIKEIPSDLTAQTYSTNEEGGWIIRIFAVLISIPKKKKKKIIEKTKRLIDEFKNEGLNENEIYEIINPEIKEEIKEKNIPINIFTKEIGVLEVIVKYFKENLNLSYVEISQLINRDQRTIWNAYKKATEKQNKTIKIKPTSLFIPINILNNKKLTLLESIIKYLKEKGFNYKQIGEMLNRDQRNIWTINSRICQKIK